MKPLSIITSTYNRSDYFLPRAIRSVLRQDFKDFEYLIIDDHSTDGTEALVRSFKDPRIRYIRLKNNFGSDTRPKNVGIKAARGKYIAYLDDDCAYRLGATRLLFEEIEKGYDVVYGDMWLVPGKGVDIHPQLGIANDFNAQFLLSRNFIDTSVAMHTKKIIEKVGGWDESLPKFVDWNLWVRMMKAGARFSRVSGIAIDYAVHKQAKSQKVKTKTWQHPTFGTMFVPTFDPPGCCWRVGEGLNPRVAIFTLTYDRIKYTKRMFSTMKRSADYPFDWFVVDNGSKDGTPGWLAKQKVEYFASKTNLGITGGSNRALDMIFDYGGYDIIGKVDNDCEFQTIGWLKDIVDLWKRNTMLYMSPYPEGLVANPGGGERVGCAEIGPYFVEVANHVGGLCAFIDAKAYKNFRWKDKFLHGNQDAEASITFRNMGYMPCYLPKHRVLHNTELQQKELSDYFERRKLEKATQA